MFSLLARGPLYMRTPSPLARGWGSEWSRPHHFFASSRPGQSTISTWFTYIWNNVERLSRHEHRATISWRSWNTNPLYITPSHLSFSDVRH